MEDQLKKTFSDALRQVPTTTEDITKTKETFLAEKFNNMEIQLDKLPSKYLLGKLPSKYEYNPFRDYMNLQSGKELKPSTTKEITEIMHKSITIKIDKTKNTCTLQQ